MELVLGSVLVVSLAFGWWMLDRRAARRSLRKIPLTRIADVSDRELVKVLGRIEIVGRSLTSPISERACAFYEITIGIDASSPCVVHERYARDFCLADDSAVALVEVRAARFAIAKKETTMVTSEMPAVARMLERHGYDLAAFHRLPLRCDEQILAVGDEACVLGRARFERDRAPARDRAAGYRDAPPRLCLEAPEGDELLATDDPNGS